MAEIKDCNTKFEAKEILYHFLEISLIPCKCNDEFLCCSDTERGKKSQDGNQRNRFQIASKAMILALNSEFLTGTTCFHSLPSLLFLLKSDTALYLRLSN